MLGLCKERQFQEPSAARNHCAKSRRESDIVGIGVVWDLRRTEQALPDPHIDRTSFSPGTRIVQFTGVWRDCYA